MCNCIEKVKEALNKKMQEERGFTEIVEDAEFVNHFICPTIEPHLPVTGKYRQGKKVRTLKASMRLNYCPFCGEKIKNNENYLLPL